MGTLFVDKLDPQSGTSLELGSSGDTVSVNTGATTNLAGNVTLGASGKTITVPSGCTITNNGTQTGFGGVMTPAFSAYGTTQNNVANNTTTVLTCSSEVFDSDGKYDTSNYRFTPGVTGKYFFYVGFKNNQSSDRLQCGIYKNGSLISEADGRMEPENNGHGSNTYTGVQGSVISICDNTSDYFQAFGWQKSGSTLTFYNARFMGYKIIE